jgi:2-methylcitrate dehydratase PrpD
MSTSRLLAQHVCSLNADELRPESRDAAYRCVLDLLTAAAAGFREPVAHAVRRTVRSQYGSGPSAIWFTGEGTSECGAVFCNSAAAAALDLDDGVRLARGHPGAAVIPAALTALSNERLQADEMLAAIVAGYEAGVRIAVARPSYAPSGAWSAFAAIAAVGRIRRMSPEIISHAFGIAAQCAPGLPGLAGLMGSDVKEGIAWGAVTGLTALCLAEAGFTGPERIFDDPALFAGERIVHGLGGIPMIEATYFKPYACCRHIHAPLDAFRALVQQHSLSAADMVSVEVHTYSGTFNLSNLPAPRDLIEAQYSVPYCVAICAVRGPQALLPMEVSILEDEAVQAFARKVTLHRDPDIERLFPARSPARVVVNTSDGRIESPVTDPRGDPSSAMSSDDLKEKFRIATRHALVPARQAEVLEAIERLRLGELAPLKAALEAA